MENRSHSRQAIELRVEYQRMNTFFADYTRNISKGGTFIRSDRPLPVGTEFLFKLTVPQRTQDLELLGLVVWVNAPTHKEHPEIDQLGMGIRFVFADDAERLRFEKEVEELMVGALGKGISTKLLGR